MDSTNQKAVTPSKSRLARAFAKVLHIQAVTGIASGDGVRKSKSHGRVKHEDVNNNRPHFFDETKDEKLHGRATAEAFLAKLFASISAIKAAYAELQFCQSPYDADGIQFADQAVVSELKNLFELKQCYLKKQLDECSPVTTQLLAEIQEQKSVLKTYEVMGKKLDSQLKLKNSEIIFLREKLEEANKENKLLEKRLSSSGPLYVLDNLHLSGLNPSHFISVLQMTVKSVRNFVRLMVNEMESAGWDLEAAARSIEPGVSFGNPNHKCFVFESFVCHKMFDGFNHPKFSATNESLAETKKQRHHFFNRFMELKSIKPKEYLARKPKSAFAKFCRTKYLLLVHPKMELSFFDNLDQRNLVDSGQCPETSFFAVFAEMAKRVWLLHCLAFSFEPEISTFQVGKRCHFSEVYMECVNEEAFLSSDGAVANGPRVAFMVVPGFMIGKTAIQCQVYLS